MYTSARDTCNPCQHSPRIDGLCGRTHWCQWSADSDFPARDGDQSSALIETVTRRTEAAHGLQRRPPSAWQADSLGTALNHQALRRITVDSSSSSSFYRKASLISVVRRHVNASLHDRMASICWSRATPSVEMNFDRNSSSRYVVAHLLQNTQHDLLSVLSRAILHPRLVECVHQQSPRTSGRPALEHVRLRVSALLD